jgi:hypothetical protein
MSICPLKVDVIAEALQMVTWPTTSASTDYRGSQGVLLALALPIF